MRQNPMSDSLHLHQLGKMTVFYVPSHKLDDLRFNQNRQSARSSIHEYLMHRYQAYTQNPTPVKGFWVNHENVPVHDVMERFEVSFHVESEFDSLIDFLVKLCERLEEDAIYVTRGDRSFLVTRMPRN